MFPLPLLQKQKKRTTWNHTFRSDPRGRVLSEELARISNALNLRFQLLVCVLPVLFLCHLVSRLIF